MAFTSPEWRTTHQSPQEVLKERTEFEREVGGEQTPNTPDPSPRGVLETERSEVTAERGGRACAFPERSLHTGSACACACTRVCEWGQGAEGRVGKNPSGFPIRKNLHWKSKKRAFYFDLGLESNRYTTECRTRRAPESSH